MLHAHPNIAKTVTEKHIADAEAAALAAGPRPTPETAPWHDFARDILAGEPRLTDDQRANAWDAYHESKDHTELASRLSGIPPETAASLVEAKRAQMPKTPFDSVLTAIHHMSMIPADVLALAESHSTVLKTLVDSVQKK